MPEAKAQVSPFMAYEHRDKNGKIVSIGKNRLLRNQKLEFTQETGTGAKMYQSLQYLPDGRMLEEKFYTDGKETEKFTFEYTKEGELLSVVDKVGVVSLSPLGVEKVTIK
jgi:antitoxin component YwqK of YwqJK toxin-antitoxin module